MFKALKSYRILPSGEIEEAKESIWSVLLELVAMVGVSYLVILLAGALN